MLRASLALYSGRGRSIPVMAGPLKGKLLPKSVALQNLAMLFGRYEPDVVREITSTPDPIKVAYDIGAHIGFMSLVLMKRVGTKGKVFAFEPVPENLASIEQLISLNRIDGLIQVVPLAVGDNNGNQNMVLWQSPFMYLLEDALDEQKAGFCARIEIETCTLDEFVFERRNPPPDFMKIDVEGAETKVLRGAAKTVKTYSPRMVIEIHGPRYACETWDLVQGFGYKWWHLISSKREAVHCREQLLSYFSSYAWTHHFLLVKEQAPEKVLTYVHCGNGEL